MARNYNFFGQNVSEEMQEKQAERVKQSQKLLKQLYHDELNPKYSTPIIRGLKIIVLVSISSLLLFSSVVTLKYNNFITMQEEVFSKRSLLEAAIQRRYNLFGNLAQLTMNHAVLEDVVFTHVADSRKDFLDKLNSKQQQKPQLFDANSPKVAPMADTKTITTAQTASPLDSIINSLSSGNGSPLGQLLAIAEQYPDIKSAETYKEMMIQMVEIENRITTSRVELLLKIQTFNTEIARFPWYYLAKFTEFSRIDYFRAETESHNRPIMSGDSFELLMPLNIKGLNK